MTTRSKITAKGQTTIPVEIRDALGLKPGDVVTYSIEGGSVRIGKTHSALEFAGILYDPSRKPLSLDEMKAWPDAALERLDRSSDDRD